MQTALVEEDDMVGEAGHGLHLAAHQQRVLLRDQQAAVEGNFGPAAGGEQGVVERAAVGQGSAAASFSLRPSDVGRSRRICLWAGGMCAVQREAAAGEAGEGHSDQAAERSRRWKPLRAFSASRAPRSTQLARRRFS